MGLMRDIQMSVRRLLNDRWFTVAAVLVLSLGLGATNTIFTFTYALFFRDLPIEGSSRFVLLTTENTARPGDRFQPATYPELQAWRVANRTLDDMGIMMFGPMNVADET